MRASRTHGTPEQKDGLCYLDVREIFLPKKHRERQLAAAIFETGLRGVRVSGLQRIKTGSWVANGGIWVLAVGPLESKRSAAASQWQGGLE
jgi:hypothetical protein